MQNLNRQMVANVLTSALTSTVTAWLSYLAAWSHFSSADNTALAAIIASGLSILICSVGTLVVNRWGFLADAVAQGGTKVITPDQASANALPNNPNVMGPMDAKVIQAP